VRRHGIRRPADGGTPAAEKHRWKMAAYVMRAFVALPPSRVRSTAYRDGSRMSCAAMVLSRTAGSWCRRSSGYGVTSRRNDGWLDVLVLRLKACFRV